LVSIDARFPRHGRVAFRYITEVRSAGFHISRGNFSAPVNVELRVARARKIQKFESRIRKEIEAYALIVNARTAYQSFLYRAERG
jgi:hypothetical protein